MEICKYGGWNHNIKLSNGQVELIITLDVGPRVLRFGFVGKQNLFREFTDQLGGTGEKDWKIRGGHRLWVAPESSSSYNLDNFKVAHKEVSPLHVVVTPAVETENGWQKELDIKLEEKSNQVTIVHRLKNLSDKPVTLALWALTVMSQKGTAVLPVPPSGTHPENLLPDRKIILWPYTDIGDARFVRKFGGKNFLVKQFDGNDTKPTKFGLLHQLKWAGYQLGADLFLKSVSDVEGAEYPDYGSNFELFTNKEILELETLAPLVTIKPGGTAEHVEKWALLSQPDAITPDTDLNGTALKALGI